MSLSPDSSSAAADLLCREHATEVTSDHHLPPPDSDEGPIAGLFDAEAHHMPEKDYLSRCRDRSVDVTARLDAVNWILKVHAFYQFSPVTAFLSVNYLDRFLSLCSLPQSSGWPFQLLSVACLSLAAKMEESHVPFLLDLQLFQPKFVFEPKTIQRMELWVMSNLKWRLRSVTPFDYLHYFISKLPSSSSSESTNHFFSTASSLILSTTRGNLLLLQTTTSFSDVFISHRFDCAVINFLGFAPSTVSAAAVLCSAGRDIASANGQLPLSFHDRVNKEMVRRCHQLMEEYVVDTCSASSSIIKARVAEPPPPSSPVGVLDAATCGSCDTPSERNFPGATEEHQQEAEPPNKRPRSSAPDPPQREKEVDYFLALGLKGHGRNLVNGIGVVGPNGPAGLSHVSDKWVHGWILNLEGYYGKLVLGKKRTM
ncbi:unnamed protein product [Sphenostylis stenocarpa]|uniref:B-like cyclin n=1 Tax=Sphenostylis stenocarpa TaxID=92480 RepID=A0AA86W3E6_9FABA|nr:unnamed protein product [Sphenostylis stenocarpa]